MKEEYYTPETSELFIGYILEYRSKSYISVEKIEWHLWTKITVNTDFLARGCSESSFDSDVEIRTKYLTKEDIESEGWSFQYQELLAVDEYNHRFFSKGRHFLEYLIEGDIIIIKIKAQTTKGREPLLIYLGSCPSINEFRKICKWLNIK